jgi:hypothetical protein
MDWEASTSRNWRICLQICANPLLLNLWPKTLHDSIDRKGNIYCTYQTMYWSDLVAQTKNGIWKRQKTENSLVRRQWNPFHQSRPSMPQIWHYLLSSASTMEGRLGSIGNDLQSHGSTCSGIGHCPGSVRESNCIVLGVDNQVQKVAPGGQICTKRVLSCSLRPWDPRNSRGATWQHNSVRSHKWVNSLQLKKVNHRPQNCKAWAILSEQRSDNFWWCQFIWVVPVFGKLLEFSAGRLRVLGSENKSTLKYKGWSEELSAGPQWKHRWELMAFHICSYIPRAYTGHLVGTMLAKHFI